MEKKCHKCGEKAEYKLTIIAEDPKTKKCTEDDKLYCGACLSGLIYNMKNNIK